MKLSALLRPTLSLVLALGLTSIVLVGCKTDKDGVKSNYAQQWTMVNGDVSEATDAAEEVLGDYDLKDVEAKSTKFDGQAMAKMADGTPVNVDVRKVTSETSEVTVRVGTVGDPTMGVEIADKIKEKLMD